MPAGEYLMVVSCQEKGSNVWSYKGAPAVEYYINDQVVTMDWDQLAGGITYVDESLSGFGT